MLVSVAAAWLWSTANIAQGAAIIKCPGSLAPDAIEPLHPPTGWILRLKQGAFLSGVGMLHGSPDELAYLKPIEIKESKKNGRAVWTERWEFPRPHGFESWLYCGYGGGNSSLQLFHRIPIDATECTSTATKLYSRGEAIEAEFICK